MSRVHTSTECRLCYLCTTRRLSGLTPFPELQQRRERMMSATHTHACLSGDVFQLVLGEVIGYLAPMNLGKNKTCDELCASVQPAIQNIIMNYSHLECSGTQH